MSKMKTGLLRTLLRTIAAPAASVVLATALAACGGGDAAQDSEGAAATSGASAATARGPQAGPASMAGDTLAVEPLMTLLDDQGHPGPSDPRAVPVDPAARTRAGLYATAAQAQALEAALERRALRTEVDASASQADAVALAVYLTYALQAAHDLPASTPVLVHGSDPRLVAIVADRLTDDGFSRVFAVAR